MKQYLLIITIFLSVICTTCGISKDDTKNGGKRYTYPDTNREGLLETNDLVLIYGGSAHRKLTWDKRHFDPYVLYKDTLENEHWLFDGFLFLEIVDGKGKIFATGYNGMPATQEEWAALLDYYFREANGICALEECIEEHVNRLGTPDSRRKIVIGIPEPIVPMRNNPYDLPLDFWGSVDGTKLDFSNDNDRIEACKWYIDYAVELFNSKQFKHLELAGFYWIAEESLHTKSILSGIAEYLNESQYSFNWIPYWKEQPDYVNWRSLKFNYAYLQPNYFFNQKVPYSRLAEACKAVKDYDMDIELEFNLRVLASNPENWEQRLYDYMQAFRDNGLLETKRIAYYQDADALHHLYKSENPEDIQLYHDFCSFVLEHQQKYLNNTK